jgi:hypothetical protein
MTMRTGLRIKGHRGHPEVREAVIRFARWLRTAFAFPVRLSVYLQPGETFLGDGDEFIASFFAPYDETKEPFIRLATGDYPNLKNERGRDDALAAILDSLVFQIIKYQQWVETGSFSDEDISADADQILYAYSQTTDHP